MLSQAGVIHILSNKYREKFGQLLECNMRNLFLEKPYTKCGGETTPIPISKKFKLSVSLNE